MLILGIETSCDETGAAVIKADTLTQPVSLLSNVIATSLALHAQTGGIIPEIAARAQVNYMLPVMDQALKDAHVTIDDIDAIAVTYGPGLIGSLLVGVETAKTISYLHNKPLIAVNHLYGHIYANWIIHSKELRAKSSERSGVDLPYALCPLPSAAITFPALALVVSGGHTDLVLMRDHGDLEVIGGTRDDAAGEAFDKIGRLLGLPYPAGSLIAKLAETGNPKAFTLPRPMIGSGDFDFSFSGLKTSVLNLVKKNEWDFHGVIPHLLEISGTGSLVETQDDNEVGEKVKLLADVCASVEEAIVDIITRKTIKAAQKYEVKSIILGGGVAANDKLQSYLRQRAMNQKLRAEIYVPQKSLCTDNAAMIAAAGFYNQNIISWRDLTANPELYF